MHTRALFYLGILKGNYWYYGKFNSDSKKSLSSYVKQEKKGLLLSK